MFVISSKSLFTIHRWIGLNCGVILFVICLSGTIATVSEEIDWLINPALRVIPAGESLAWDQLGERVEGQYPEVSIRTIHSPRNRRTAAFVDVESDTGQRATFLVNPYTGDVQGVVSYHCAKVLFRVFHKQFYIFGFPKGIHGTYFVGTYGLTLLIAGLTGLLFYRRFWARLFVLRWNGGWDLFWRDSHRLLGVWTALALLIWSLTGVWYVAQKVIQDRDTGSSWAHLPLWWEREDATGNLPPSQLTASELGIADYMKIVEREFPELEVMTLYLPQQAGGPATVMGSTGALLAREDSGQLLIDSLTGEVLARQTPEDLSPFDRWAVTADPLHFGTFGGLPTKILWCVFGLGVSALIPIGATIWYRRTKRRAEHPEAQGTGTYRSRRARIISITLNSMILAAAVGYTCAMSPPRVEEEIKPVSVAEVGTIQIGPWTANLARIGPITSRQHATFRIRFRDSALPNMQRATMRLGDQEEEFSGTWNFHCCKLLLPKDAAFDGEMILRIEARDGSVHQHRFPHQAWSSEGKVKSPPVPAAQAPILVTAIFVSFFLVVGLFAGVWFWNVG